MCKLKLNHYIIDKPLQVIIKQLKSELPTIRFREIIDKKTSVVVTCPFHNGGNEKHASCFINNNESLDIPYGYVHCFGCGYKANLQQFISDCFQKDINFGIEWLIARFGYLENNDTIDMPDSLIFKKENKELDESYLETLLDYHPYMTKRKLSDDVIKKFHIKYDPKTETIVFPVWDEKNKLKLLTRRSIQSKNFYIDSAAEKPVYLLNFILKENIQTVYVTESQINALTLWGWGYPAVALFGTGSANQYKILNKADIRSYILCFDGDAAGKAGELRFKKNIKSDRLITTVCIPAGKDVNDLTREEFNNLLQTSNI